MFLNVGYVCLVLRKSKQNKSTYFLELVCLLYLLATLTGDLQ